MGTVIGLLRDEIGKRFEQRYRKRFGEHSTPEVGCQPYNEAAFELPPWLAPAAARRPAPG